ncbi:hypothetical protein HAX54_027565, partial [Datura stramonium]|nr:hypothetical protein [Datura stramonium]
RLDSRGIRPRDKWHQASGKSAQKRKAPPTASDEQNKGRVERMEDYYVFFKEKISIHAETQFEVECFKDDFPNIYYQIHIRDWGPFTTLVGPYFPELVWVFYAFYRVPIKVELLFPASWIKHTSMSKKSLQRNSKERQA